MKLIGLLLLTACFTCIAAVHDVQELIALGYKCGGTEDDVKWAVLYELSDTRTSKCMYACITKYYGIRNQQGVYSKEHMIKYVKTNWPEFDSYAYAVAENLDQEMKKYSPKHDECEYGYQVVKCMRDYANEALKVGIPLVDRRSSDLNTQHGYNFGEKSYISYAERARRLQMNIQNGMNKHVNDKKQNLDKKFKKFKNKF